MSLLTATPADDNTPGRKPEVPSNPTAGHGSNIQGKPAQTTIFDLPGVTGATHARDACDAHDADPSEANAGFIDACEAALFSAVQGGPCSMPEARLRHGVGTPSNVDGRAAGAAAMRLWRDGKIEPAGWFDHSPWIQCHDAPSRVWRLPAKGRK